MPSSPLHGRWQMIRAELAGEAAPELVIQHTMLELADRRYVVHFHGEPVDGGRCEPSDDAAPHALILRGEFGVNAGRTIPSIFQLVGDRLRICYGLDGTRPASFATAGLPQRYVATYRRL